MTGRCDLDAVEARYSRALDAKPGKGEYSPDGIAAIVDSHCDVRELVAEIRALRAAATEPARVLPSRESLAVTIHRVWHRAECECDLSDLDAGEHEAVTATADAVLDLVANAPTVELTKADARMEVADRLEWAWAVDSPTRPRTIPEIGAWLRAWGGQP